MLPSGLTEIPHPTTPYVYGGPAANIGRFGLVAQGTVLPLTDAEIEGVAGDANWAPLPSPSGVTILEKTGDYTLVSGTDSGKIVVAKHSAALAITLPAAPVVGDHFEVYDASAGGASVNNITILPQGEHTIDGEANFVMDEDGQQFGCYWNGSQWIQHVPAA